MGFSIKSSNGKSISLLNDEPSSRGVALSSEDTYDTSSLSSNPVGSPSTTNSPSAPPPSFSRSFAPPLPSPLQHQLQPHPYTSPLPSPSISLSHQPGSFSQYSQTNANYPSTTPSYSSYPQFHTQYAEPSNRPFPDYYHPYNPHSSHQFPVRTQQPSQQYPSPLMHQGSLPGPLQVPLQGSAVHAPSDPQRPLIQGPLQTQNFQSESPPILHSLHSHRTSLPPLNAPVSYSPTEPKESQQSANVAPSAPKQLIKLESSSPKGPSSILSALSPPPIASSTHRTQRKYTCHCSRSFTTSGHLARHMRIHTGEKNYICPHQGCGARFSRQDNCMQHFRTHLGGRSRRGSGNGNGGGKGGGKRIKKSNSVISSPKISSSSSSPNATNNAYDYKDNQTDTSTNRATSVDSTTSYYGRVDDTDRDLAASSDPLKALAGVALMVTCNYAL